MTKLFISAAFKGSSSIQIANRVHPPLENKKNPIES